MVQTERAMDFMVYFLALLFQIDPVLPDCTVDNCDPNNCNGNSCTKCIHGFYPYVGKCYECYLHCRRCHGECYRCPSSSCPTEMCAYANCPTVACYSSQNIYCSSCPDGFYNSNGTCYRCLHTNCKCTTYDDCVECLPGKYGSNFCNNNCPGNCTLCTSTAHYSECIAGTYGQSCQSECIDSCQVGTCDKETGTCLHECPVGQFLSAAITCLNCPHRCSSCTDYYACTSCNNNPIYKWGSRCQYDCTTCSNSGCSKIDGCSSGCDRHDYYQTYNELRQGFDCTNCPTACERCKNETQCTKCKVGYWGSLCNKPCGSGCTTYACDQSQGCTVGCIFGYYHKLYSNTYTCVECPQHCKICLEPNKCHECEQGYYLNGGRTCIACSAQCKIKICNQNNGSCKNGCFGNSTGHRCDKHCFSNCLKCSQFNASDCSMCEKGFYGPSCERECSSTCSQIHVAGNQTCEKNDGQCIDGCKNSYWGSHCDRTCEEGCNGNICNETTGECLFGCKTTHYGTNCETECSQTCYSLGQGVRVCDVVNGSCVACCVVGFTGSYCNETAHIPGSTESSKPNKLDNTNTPAITGLSVVVGIALLLLTVSVIFNVILLRNRRVSSPHDSDPPARQRELDSTDYEDLNRNNPDSSNYSSVTRVYENTNI